MIQNQNLSPHFTLAEMCESQTAQKHGIANIPSPEAVANLRRLCEGTLEPLREAIGLPIIITSGFRTKALNDKLAHAASRSQHMEGCAADFYVSSAGSRVQGSRVQGASRRELLIKAFREILHGSMDSPQGRKIDFDQLILYPTFIHVSFVSKEKNRRGILLARSDGKLGYGRITLSNALKIS